MHPRTQVYHQRVRIKVKYSTGIVNGSIGRFWNIKKNCRKIRRCEWQIKSRSWKNQRPFLSFIYKKQAIIGIKQSFEKWNQTSKGRIIPDRAWKKAKFLQKLINKGMGTKYNS